MVHRENRLLAALPTHLLHGMRAHLQAVDLAPGQVLSEIHGDVRRVYFPQTGIISLIVELRTGDSIETAMVGHDGVLNASSSLDGRISVNKSVVQRAGVALVMRVRAFQEFAATSSKFRDLLLHHEQVLFAQAQQSAACNACHSIEARLCRWLLRMRDLADGDDIVLTHEQFAQMVGVRRSGVSLAAEVLQKAGWISYHRGVVRVTNLERIRDHACECYDVVKRLYEDLTRV